MNRIRSVRIRHVIVGKESGNFKFQNKDPDIALFTKNVEDQLDERHVQKIYIPAAAHSTKVATPETCEIISLTDRCLRTESGIDAFMVTGPNTAIGFLNADCPIVALTDKSRNSLVLIHAGFRCLVPINREEPSIIKRVFEKFELDPSSIDEVFIGYGAGTCCYGVHNLMHELRERKLGEFAGIATKGPRIGAISFDLYGLAQKQIIDCGVRLDNIYICKACTACISRDREKTGKYYSHLYGEEGRNLSFAYFQ
jgi:copper oxidase (laccase) domain-containing protein